MNNHVPGETAPSQSYPAVLPPAEIYKVGNPPSSAMITVDEAAVWIVYRRAIPHNQLGCLYHGHYGRKANGADFAIWEALRARAMLSYAVACDYDCGKDTIPSRYDILTKNGPRGLRGIRAQCRRASGNLLSYGELAKQFGEALMHDVRVSGAIHEARGFLKDKAAGSEIVAYGVVNPSQLGSDRKKPVEPIDPGWLMHDAVIFEEFSGLGTSDRLPRDNPLRARLPKYDLIRFRTEDVLKLWPVQAHTENTAAPDEVSPIYDTPQGKPKPTNPAVRSWLHNRLATWPDDKPAPSEPDEFAALNEHFAPGLSRDDFRDLRKLETPAPWRRQGKRQPWGQVKHSAPNPRNCGPQN